MADLLARRLRCKIVLCGNVPVQNDFNQTTYKDGPIKSLWAEILPKSGAQKTTDGEMIYTEYTHVITVRAKAVPEITGDMYILHGGHRLDIAYAMPHYRYRDRIEIYAKEQRGDGNGY